MHRRIASLICGLSLLASSAARAQTPEPLPAPHPSVAAPAKPAAAAPLRLTLDSAIAMALEKQPTIQAARIGLASAESGRATAYSALASFSPQVDVRRKQADLGVAIAVANLTQVENETKHAVTRCYLTAVYALEQQKLAENAEELLRATEQTADRLVNVIKSKDLTAEDINRLKVFRLLAESKVGEARVGLVRAIAALREAIGLDPDCEITVGDEKLDLFYQRAEAFQRHGQVRLSCRVAVAAALEQRPELQQAALFAQITCLEIEAQRRTWAITAPTFAASSDIHAKILPAGMNNGEYKPGPVGPEYPPFLIGTVQQRTDKAHWLHQRSIVVVDKARSLIALDVDESCARLNREAEQIVLLRKANEQTKKLFDTANKAFGDNDLKLDVFFAAYTLDLKAKADLNEAYYKFGLTLASLQRATVGNLWNCFAKE